MVSGIDQLPRAAARPVVRELKRLGELLMKKHLIAAAVAAAVAVPAMAQNVTMDGVIDSMYGSVDRGGTAATTGKFVGVVTNVFATSQMNIRGTEDLGGGVKAGFRLSRQFGAAAGTDNGTALGTYAAAGANGPGARDSGTGWNEVSVNFSGGFGTISAGLQDIAGKEAFGYGRHGNFGRTWGALYTMGDERAGTVNYFSPRVNGVQVVLGHATGTRSGDPAALTLGKTSGVGISFEDGPVKIGYNTAKGDSGGTNTGQESALGASYNAGIATVAFSYLTHDRVKETNGKQSNTLISASAPLGGGLNLMGAWLKFKDTEVAAGTENSATGYQVALTKDLSKRTMIYAQYANLTNGAGTNYNMRGLTRATNAGEDPSAFGIGFNHKF